MRKIVLGFGVSEIADREEPAIRLLGRLRFADAVIDTVHVVEPPPLMFLAHVVPTVGNVISDTMQEEERAAQQEGKVLASRLRAEGMAPGATAVVFGRGIAAQLTEYADSADAALIAVGSHGKKPARAFLTGSVGRGLVIAARRSLLIVKGGRDAVGGVRALFATDHSDYANRCLTTLLHLAPGGISHLTVLTVYPIESARAVLPLLPAGVGDPAEWVARELQDRNAEVIRRLAPLGCECDSCVADGHADEVIPEVLREMDADLLILGAKGHGFVERLDVGSTSLHEALTEERSVLLLRA